MPSRKELTQEIDRAPSGPKIAAFFDVDRTLLAGFSAVGFMKDKFTTEGFSLGDMARAVAGTFRFGTKQTSFPSFLEETSTNLVGLTEHELLEQGERVFAKHLVTDIYPESRALVEAHQRRGHTVAIVSSATHFQIDALAKELGIEHVLCTELEFEKGKFTGKVRRPACWQEGKADAAGAFSEQVDADLSQSYFYTDSHDDLALLDLVGNPRLVNPDSELARVGARRGWPVYQFSSRGRPGAREIAGLVGSLTSLGPAALVGLPAALASGSLRKGADLMLSTYAELTTALTGVELNVEGEEHLWSHRPAVFIFNHQSGLDSILMAQLTQRDVVVRRPRRSREGDRGHAAGGRGDAQGSVRGDCARRNAQRDEEAGQVQEGCIPHGDGRGCPDRSGGPEERARCAAAQRNRDSPRHGGRGGAPADCDIGVEARGPRRPHCRDREALRGDPGELALWARERAEGAPAPQLRAASPRCAVAGAPLRLWARPGQSPTRPSSARLRRAARSLSFACAPNRRQMETDRMVRRESR
jgi:HAD superfamily hydrolase (TIGR01490 family)